MSCRMAAVAALVGVLTAPLLADPAADEAKRLEGTWVVESATLGGKKFDRGVPTELVFAGKELTFRAAGGKEEKMTYTVDPGKRPKWMDFEPGKRPAGAGVGAGVYELDGDTLKLCLGATRPKEIADRDGPLLVLKRKK